MCAKHTTSYCLDGYAKWNLLLIIVLNNLFITSLSSNSIFWNRILKLYYIYFYIYFTEKLTWNKKLMIAYCHQYSSAVVFYRSVFFHKNMWFWRLKKKKRRVKAAKQTTLYIIFNRRILCLGKMYMVHGIIDTSIIIL